MLYFPMRMTFLLTTFILAGCSHMTPNVHNPIPTAAERLREGDTLFARREYAAAGKVFADAAARAETQGNASVRVEALSMAARSDLIRGEAEADRTWLARAAALATPEDPRGWSRYLGVRGRFEWQDDKNNPKATATFKEMYEYCMDRKLNDRAVDTAHMVAITGRPDEQIAWAYKGIAAAEAGGYDGWLGPMWNNLGWSYDGRGQYDEALTALLKAREYHHKSSDALAKLAADIFVGRAYRMTGNLDESQRWIDDAHRRAQQLSAEKPDDENITERLANTHEQLGELTAARGENAAALEHFTQSRRLLIEAGDETWGPDEIKRVDERIRSLTTGSPDA